MTDTRHRLWLFLSLILVFSLLCSCGSSARAQAADDDTKETAQAVAEEPSALKSEPGQRPNTPVVLVPEAPGDAVIGSEPLVVDISHLSEGYIMALYSGSAAKACIQLTGPDELTYKYFLPPSEDYACLPLTAGSGTYELAAYENVTDSQYASLYKENLDVTLEDELLPYLYPNLYVDFTPDSKAVAAAVDIVAPADTDLEAVELAYHYVLEHVTYDTSKAETVSSGYLPDVDETLATGRGICFDYAALTAAMLRSQGIPTRLEIGYVGDVYHAWISVYVDELGWIDKLIEFTGDGWTRMDPTFASSENSSSTILQYIGDGSNYTLQYLH